MERELELLNQGLEKLSGFTAIAFASLVVVFLIVAVVIGYAVFRRLNIAERRINEERDKALKSSSQEQQTFASQLIELVGKSYERAFDGTVDKLTVVFTGISTPIALALDESRQVIEAQVVANQRRDSLFERGLKEIQQGLSQQIQTHDAQAQNWVSTILASLSARQTEIAGVAKDIRELAKQRDLSSETQLNQLSLAVKGIETISAELKALVRNLGGGGDTKESPLSPPASQGEVVVKESET